MSNDINEANLLNTYPIPVTIESTKIILEQMENSICKIITGERGGTGFFCHINYQNKKLKCLITNNHIINEKIIKNNNNIIVELNNDKKKINIKIDDSRKIYTNEEKYDTTIIEIKPEKDKINTKNFVEIDINIFEENINLINKSIYVPQYLKNNCNEYKPAVSYGIIKEIKNDYKIIHLCNTDKGSSGSPILNLANNKIIGIHSEGYKNYNFNLGTLLKYPIEEYLNNINLIKRQKHNTKEDSRCYYEINKKIFEDDFFDYFEVIEKETGMKKAIKLLDKNKINNEIRAYEFREINIEEANSFIKDDLMKYIETIKTIEEKNKENENTVKYYEYFDNDKEFVIVMEYWDDNLLHEMAERKKPFNVEEINELLCQLNNVFKIMYENKVIHGNLNLENILIKKEDDKKLLFKLSNNYNLGERYLSFIYDEVYDLVPKNISYKAPELLNGNDKYNELCDLWSLGIIIYALFFKKFPYSSINEYAYLNQIKDLGQKILEKTGNENLDDLIKKLLIEDPKKRITFKEYFNHPFFKKEF